jgi:ABC-2 type transport system ATP-binding protein
MLTASVQSNAPPLRVANLVKTYGSGRGVRDVSFQVAGGSITGFIGANGAGKSTTLKAIIGLIRPDAGVVELFGRPNSFAARARLGFLPEERGLVPRDRASDAIAFQARLKGYSRKDAYRRADMLLERVGLADRRRAPIRELSKGNAQRVQILCAIAHDPALLVLDEPFTGLDVIAQAEVQSLFSEFRSKGGAILFSTHSMQVAERLCDHVVVMADGRSVFEGPLAEATAQAPHGVYVTVDDETTLMEVVRGLGAKAEPFAGKMGEALRWRVLLPSNVPYPALMRALADRQLAVYGFEPIQADLEGAFWALAGERAAA